MGMYEELTIRELQTECKARGIGSGTSKAKLIAKLVENDTPTPQTFSSTPEIVPDTDTVEVVAENVSESSVVASTQYIADDPDETYDAGTHKFQKTFPHTGDLTSDKHDAYRRAIRQEVISRGFQPYGGEYDAYLLRKGHNTLTYEIEIRG